MESGLRVAVTGMKARNDEVTNITNNLANISTVGFKAGRVEFQDLMYQVIHAPGASTSEDTEFSSGLSIGTGVKTASIRKEFKQGNGEHTENPLDVMIEGNGFFQITKGDGTLSYTRDGQFHLNSDGNLVTSSGYLLEPQITIPQGASAFTIGADGIVSAIEPGSTTPTEIGTIQLSAFINPAGLLPVGENAYIETASSGSPQVSTPGADGAGALRQGFVEGSTVDLVTGMIGLIQAQRGYETLAKGVKTIEEMQQFFNNNV